MLPSKEPTEAAPQFTLQRSPQGGIARGLADRGLWREAAPELEKMARGDFGDSLFNRQSAEYYLAVARFSMHDYGGAFDLVRLMLADDMHERASSSLSLLRGWAANECRTGPALTLLAQFHNEYYWRRQSTEHRPSIGDAQLDALTARGLVEEGRDDEARVLLTTPLVLKHYPEFSAQCQRFIESRRAHSSITMSSPTQLRPCRCDIEPAQWMEGCGCESPQSFVAPDAPEPKTLPPPGESNR
jgi:hypothetical protein